MEGDANARKVQNVADGFTQNLPFGTMKLKPKMNVWGEEIVLEGGVLRQWLPFKYRTEKPDALEKELERIGVYPSIPENKYNHYDSKKLKTVKLDIPDKVYEEARIYYGSLLKKSLTAAMEKESTKKLWKVKFSSTLLKTYFKTSMPETTASSFKIKLYLD